MLYLSYGMIEREQWEHSDAAGWLWANMLPQEPEKVVKFVGYDELRSENGESFTSDANN